MIDRERKVDLDKMSEEQIGMLEKKMSEKLQDILSRASKEANNFLNIYGIEIKIAYELQPKQQPEVQAQ